MSVHITDKEMRHLTLLLVLCCIFASCKKKEPDYSQRLSYYYNIAGAKVYDTALRVITYNIQNGFPSGMDPWNKYMTGGTPGYLDSMAAFLASTGADVIALQEVPLDRSNIVVKHLLDSLAWRLNMNYAFTSHGYNDAYYSGDPVKGQWGVAILSKYPIVDIDSREVSYLDVWTRRSTLRAKLRLNDVKSINVYSLHHKPMHDWTDLQKTADFVHESILPVIVCGDFNSGPDMPLLYLGLNPAWDAEQMAIDMIFQSPEFTPQTFKDYQSLGLSDHSPIMVQFRY